MGTHKQQQQQQVEQGTGKKHNKKHKHKHAEKAASQQQQPHTKKKKKHKQQPAVPAPPGGNSGGAAAAAAVLQPAGTRLAGDGAAAAAAAASGLQRVAQLVSREYAPLPPVPEPGLDLEGVDDPNRKEVWALTLPAGLDVDALAGCVLHLPHRLPEARHLRPPPNPFTDTRANLLAWVKGAVPAAPIGHLRLPPDVARREQQQPLRLLTQAHEFEALSVGALLPPWPPHGGSAGRGEPLASLKVARLVMVGDDAPLLDARRVRQLKHAGAPSWAAGDGWDGVAMHTRRLRRRIAGWQLAAARAAPGQDAAAADAAAGGGFDEEFEEELFSRKAPTSARRAGGGAGQGTPAAMGGGDDGDGSDAEAQLPLDHPAARLYAAGAGDEAPRAGGDDTDVEEWEDYVDAAMPGFNRAPPFVTDLEQFLLSLPVNPEIRAAQEEAAAQRADEWPAARDASVASSPIDLASLGNRAAAPAPRPTSAQPLASYDELLKLLAEHGGDGSGDGSDSGSDSDSADDEPAWATAAASENEAGGSPVSPLSASPGGKEDEELVVVEEGGSSSSSSDEDSSEDEDMADAPQQQQRRQHAQPPPGAASGSAAFRQQCLLRHWPPPLPMATLLALPAELEQALAAVRGARRRLRLRNACLMCCLRWQDVVLQVDLARLGDADMFALLTAIPGVTHEPPEPRRMLAEARAAAAALTGRQMVEARPARRPAFIATDTGYAPYERRGDDAAAPAAARAARDEAKQDQEVGRWLLARGAGQRVALVEGEELRNRGFDWDDDPDVLQREGLHVQLPDGRDVHVPAGVSLDWMSELDKAWRPAAALGVAGGGAAAAGCAAAAART